jgi:hypothetical protein
MKIFIRYILIFISPFILLALINEVIRIKIKAKPYSAHGIEAINSNEYNSEKCTWACHNNTSYCKTHHVKYLKPFYAVTDVFYFGVIAVLASTGNYGVANIIFLVFLFPITILYLFIKSLNIQKRIGKLSN